jgi:hypothetical protein
MSVPRGQKKAVAAASVANLNRGGRRKGSKNQVSKASLPEILEQVVPQLERQQSLDEVLAKTLGLEVDSPVKIDGKGVDMRDRIARFLAGDPTVQFSPEQLRLFALLFSHRYGRPDKRKPPDSGRKTLNFITGRGLPWQNDPMAEQQRQAVAGLLRQEKIEAAAAERRLRDLETDPDDDENTPELVR